MPQKWEGNSIGRRDLGTRRSGKHTVVKGTVGNGTIGKAYEREGHDFSDDYSLDKGYN